MPKFMYTLFALTLLVWSAIIYVFSQSQPDSSFKILVAALALFVAFTLLFTDLVFIVLNAKASYFLNKHLLFRKALKYGTFGSACLTGYLTLRAFDLATILNTILYISLCFILYTQLKSKRV